MGSASGWHEILIVGRCGLLWQAHCSLMPTERAERGVVAWPASWRTRAEREPELYIVGAADDLLEYQANPQGGWVMPDVAGCAI